MTRAAVVLVSGGLDSATTLALARRDGYACYALSFDYGQRPAQEIRAAAAVAQHFGVRQHRTMKIDLRAFGGSALTADINVPKDHLQNDAIPVTYVPARNTVFLALALAWAETLDCCDLFIGVNAVDYSGYPDCRPEFVHAFEALANLATKAAVEGRGRYRVHTPLITLSKMQIIQQGVALGVPYELTHSCYDPAPDGAACGHCDSCLLRREGFRQAGLRDPVRYSR